MCSDQEIPHACMGPAVWPGAGAPGGEQSGVHPSIRNELTRPGRTFSLPQVTQLRVFVSVLDVNDNPPRFPYETKLWEVPEVS